MTIDTRTRVTRRSSTLQSLEATTCVVGSGAAGIMAALTAARLGHRTVLMEAGPVLGGQLVGTLLGTICGLYSNGEHPLRVTFGAVDELLADLRGRGALAPRRALDSWVLMYDEALAGRWAERALLSAGVTVVLGATLRQVHLHGRRIGSLDFATRWGDLKVKADGVVDASGDAAVAWHAGLAVREPETPQWGTQMITIEGYDDAHAEDFDGFDVATRLRERGASYGLERRDGFVFAFPGRGIATANLTHMPTPMEPVAATRDALQAREQADRVMAMLREEYPRALGRARIRAYGQPGIRQTRWIVGQRQLSIAEVANGRRPADAVARCAWPVEAHDAMAEVAWNSFGPGHMHYVPLASMLHRDADNLVAAGRCIDADTAALASVRVMGPCFAMGQAAAHALDLATRAGSTHEVSVAALQERIHDNLERFGDDGWDAA